MAQDRGELIGEWPQGLLPRLLAELRRAGLWISPAEAVAAARALAVVDIGQRRQVQGALGCVLAHNRRDRATFDAVFTRLATPPKADLTAVARAKATPVPPEGNPPPPGASRGNAPQGPKGRGKSKPSPTPAPTPDRDSKGRGLRAGVPGWVPAPATSPPGTSPTPSASGPPLPHLPAALARRPLRQTWSAADEATVDGWLLNWPRPRVGGGRRGPGRPPPPPPRPPPPPAAPPPPPPPARGGGGVGRGPGGGGGGGRGGGPPPPGRTRRGRLWPAATSRRALQSQGIPLVLTHRPPPQPTWRLVLLIDVSCSVQRPVRWFVSLAAPRATLTRRARTFVFVNHPVATRLPREGHRGTDGVGFARWLTGHGLDLQAASDYGRTFESLRRHHSHAFSRRTLWVIFGDGRVNRYDPNLRCYASLCRRCGGCLWVIPETPTAWGTWDSALDVYLPHARGALAAVDLQDLVAAMANLDHWLNHGSGRRPRARRPG